jgi:hypothetical protein
VTRKEDVRNGSNDVMVDLVLGATGSRPRFANTAPVEVLALDATRAKHGDNFIVAGSPSGKSIEWNDVTEACAPALSRCSQKRCLAPGRQPGEHPSQL